MSPPLPKSPPLLAAAVLIALALAGCGASAKPGSQSARNPSTTASSAQQEGVSYARCMRAHGISNFPDPSASGGFNLNTSGINAAAPATKTAETACQRLLPVKQVPSQQPTAAAYARLVHWAQCLRRHGISGVPDPKPDPPPGPGSGGHQRYDTLIGDGGYWVGIPLSVNAHSSTFLALSRSCSESPTGHHR